jgi:hypothetical protein
MKVIYGEENLSTVKQSFMRYIELIINVNVVSVDKPMKVINRKDVDHTSKLNDLSVRFIQR